MVLAPFYDALLPMLKEGKGDFIAASLTATPERAREVDFTRPYLFVKELVVQPRGKAPLTTLEHLRGRVITVRRSSSYAERLRPLFQVMPATGQELGFTRLKDPEQGTQAGIKYMSQLVRRVEPAFPSTSGCASPWLATTRALPGCKTRGASPASSSSNPDVWAGNVEKAMGLMARPKYARRVRTGFCRCQEPVDYVRVIENKYESFLQSVP